MPVDALVVIDDLDRVERAVGVTVLNRPCQSAVALQGLPVLRPAFAAKMNIKVVDREPGKRLKVIVVEFQGRVVGMQHASVMTNPNQQILHVIQTVVKNAEGAVIHCSIFAGSKMKCNVEWLFQGD